MSVNTNYKVHLSEYPQFPVENHNRLDADETLRWINAHPSEMQGYVSELANRVEHISFSEFNQNFNGGINFLNSLTKQDSLNDYMLMVEPGKSNQWMAEIAMSQLSTKPTQIYSLGNKGSNFINYLNEQRPAERPYYPNTVVFFDDGIYSGKQMSLFIKGVFDAFKEFNANASKENLDEIEQPDVVVVAPYATAWGVQNILKVNENESDKIQFCPHNKINTLAETLTPYTADRLNATLWKNDPRDTETNAFKFPCQNGVNSRGNIWFDHKIPNWLSFVFALEAGIVTDSDGSLLNGKVSFNQQHEPTFDAIANQQFAPIPSTLPPYKRKNI